MEQISKQAIPEWFAVQGATKGRSHLAEGTECQDKTCILRKNGILSVALADGAGSAVLSHEGAATVTRTVCELLCGRFDEFHGSESQLSVRRTIIERLRESLQETAAVFGCALRDLASTLLAVAISGNRYLILHLGDGVIGYTKNGVLKVASAPQNGEFANTTYFVTSSRAVEMMRTIKGTDPLIDGFTLMSDGCEASLYDKRKQYLAPVLGQLLHRLSVTSETFLQPSIQRSLDNVVSTRTMDDCSLILTTRRGHAYNEMNQEELKEFFQIDSPNGDIAERQSSRFIHVLDALDKPMTERQLKRKLSKTDKFAGNARFWRKHGINPLIEMGYLARNDQNRYQRTIEPSFPSAGKK